MKKKFPNIKYPYTVKGGTLCIHFTKRDGEDVPILLDVADAHLLENRTINLAPRKMRWTGEQKYYIQIIIKSEKDPTQKSGWKYSKCSG